MKVNKKKLKEFFDWLSDSILPTAGTHRDLIRWKKELLGEISEEDQKELDWRVKLK